MAKRLYHNGTFFTLAGASGWGTIERGAMVVNEGGIEWIGPEAEQLVIEVIDKIDLAGRVVTPGFIDCHSHLVYGGDRAAEFEQRLHGATYEQIARAGGGIRSTVRATRAASDNDLFEFACARAKPIMAEGVTTLEIKSGYGLSEVDEARCLRVARRIGRELNVTVKTTFLAAHAVSPEFEGRADDYIDAVCAWMPRLAAEGLIDAVDGFCETIAFTTAQMRRVFEAARALELPVKLHAEQLSNQGGAILAAEFGALSCDHIEYLDDAGVAAMAKAGSVAVLLPGAFYFLREKQAPPIAALRTVGVPMALATDHNPGSSPVMSLLAMIHMGCTLFRLTPEEAIRGVTVNAAQALGLSDRGRLMPGQRADFVVWDVRHPHELAYWLGRNPCHRVFVGGVERS